MKKKKKRICVAIKTYMIYIFMFDFFFITFDFFVVFYSFYLFGEEIILQFSLFVLFPRRDETMKSNKMRNEKQYTNGTKKKKVNNNKIFN